MAIDKHVSYVHQLSYHLGAPLYTFMGHGHPFSRARAIISVLSWLINPMNHSYYPLSWFANSTNIHSQPFTSIDIH